VTREDGRASGVSRRGEYPHLRSLDDPRLRRLRIGVHPIGDDFANSPPAHALSARDLVRNIVGSSVLGDYSQPASPARIVDAVAGQEVDVALVWGPLAGYFAGHAWPPLDVSPIGAAPDGPWRPFAFDISMAVRKDDVARQRALDAFIVRQRERIDRLLTTYGVPRVTPEQRES
jgi:mxaJ protein